MNSKCFILMIILLLAFLISCDQEVVETAPSLEPSGSQWGSIQPHSKIKQPAPNAEIISLLAKNSDATNYHYVFDADKAEGYEVFIRGDKIKVVYSEKQKSGENTFYNVLYLNSKIGTAVAICTIPGVACEDMWGLAYRANYIKIEPTPMEIIQSISNPQEIGSEVLLNRQLTIIEYNNTNNQRELLSIDNFYGLPSRQVIYESTDENAPIQESHTFTKLSVGQVDDKEVTLPQEYVMQE